MRKRLRYEKADITLQGKSMKTLLIASKTRLDGVIATRQSEIIWNIAMQSRDLTVPGPEMSL